MKQPRVRETLTMEDGSAVVVREALAEDASALADLYFQVYGGAYTLPEVNDRDLMRRVLNDPHHLWLVAEEEGRLAGATLFQVDPVQRLGKSAAGGVLAEHRGHKLMVALVRRGLTRLLEEEQSCDLVYAVVRTFISPAVHEDLKTLGFVDLGVFPNVRKLARHETHGFKVCYGPRALAARVSPPHLIPQANRIYEIARRRLNLESAVVEEFETQPAPVGGLNFEVERGAGMLDTYQRKKAAGELGFAFFPFHEPQLRFHTPDGATEAYIHFQPKDGHASLLGLTTDQRDVMRVLDSISLKGDSLGFNYLELILDAYDAATQWKAYLAGFLPCAYAPGLRLDAGGRRHDYVVTCRFFVPLHLAGLKLTEDIKPYMKVFIVNSMNKLLEDVENG